MPKPSPKSDKAREYRKQYGSKMATKTLARILHNENAEMFESAEDARGALRYIEGKRGNGHRQSVKGSEFFEAEERSKAPVEMPESWSKVKPVFKLPIACNRIAFMSDFQIPFHNKAAIIAFVEWVKKKEPNTVFINSDFVDFYGISMYEKNPKMRDFKGERDAAISMLTWLRDQFPTQTIYYNLDGNHEQRLEKWLYRHPEVYGMPEFEIENILQLNKNNIIPLRNHKYIEIGKLHVLHGHTVFGRWGSGVSKGRSVFLKTLVNTMVSHVHITDEWTTRNLVGDITTCWTTGCFMDIDAVEYNEHNNYNNGGAYIETDSEGNFWVENKKVIKGKIF